jgi:hypothetical protein
VTTDAAPGPPIVVRQVGRKPGRGRPPHTARGGANLERAVRPNGAEPTWTASNGTAPPAVLVFLLVRGAIGPAGIVGVTGSSPVSSTHSNNCQLG